MLQLTKTTLTFGPNAEEIYYRTPTDEMVEQALGMNDWLKGKLEPRESQRRYERKFGLLRQDSYDTNGKIIPAVTFRFHGGGIARSHYDNGKPCELFGQAHSYLLDGHGLRAAAHIGNDKYLDPDCQELFAQTYRAYYRLGNEVSGWLNKADRQRPAGKTKGENVYLISPDELLNAIKRDPSLRSG
jgi:hypothetical protein